MPARTGVTLDTSRQQHPGRHGVPAIHTTCLDASAGPLPAFDLYVSFSLPAVPAEAAIWGDNRRRGVG